MKCLWRVVVFPIALMRLCANGEQLVDLKVGYGRFVLKDGSCSFKLAVLERKDGLIRVIDELATNHSYSVFKVRKESTLTLIAGTFDDGAPSISFSVNLNDDFFSLDYFHCNTAAVHVSNFPKNHKIMIVIPVGGGKISDMIFKIKSNLTSDHISCGPLLEGRYLFGAGEMLQSENGNYFVLNEVREMDVVFNGFNYYGKIGLVASWDDMDVSKLRPEELCAMSPWLLEIGGDEKGGNKMTIKIDSEMVGQITGSK